MDIRDSRLLIVASGEHLEVGNEVKVRVRWRGMNPQNELFALLYCNLLQTVRCQLSSTLPGVSGIFPINLN
jgi:hypothetical protein